jgi:rapamycin-insensitive companion of mTOR
MSLRRRVLLFRTLARDAKHEHEKIQTMRLIRHLLALRAPLPEMTCSILRAVVAVSENSEDSLKLVALETLAELCTVVQGHGFVTVLDIILTILFC